VANRDPVPEPGSLRGRSSECALLDDVIGAVRAGESRTLVLHGEAGIGKTALLNYVVESAADMRLLRAAGVESEMELAFASLHQLCAPLLEAVERLPPPQRHALEIAFGLSEGPAPDRFLVGLALLTLLSDAAEERPVLCVVDDAQWLDEVSVRTLAFAARRLLAEPVGLLLAARVAASDLQGLPDLEVLGLHNGDARAILHSAVPFRLDDRVRDRIVAETRGNPLALLELPRGLTLTQLAGGFGLLDAQALPTRLEESFQRRLEALPDQARLFLLVAAAEPVGDPLLVWRAAERLGIEGLAADADTGGLLTIAESVTFRHPLVRSAVYRSAPVEQRRAVHMALAEATNRKVDPDRRAWHLAAATLGPDEEVARELEQSAGRAQARGGVAATAAFLQRAVALTRDPDQRPERVIAAAEASFLAGAFDAALGLAATAEAGAVDEFQCARLDLLRGNVAFASGRVSDAPPLLLKAARRLESLDDELARQTYLTAWGAASVAGGQLAGEGALLEISHAVQALPPRPGAPRPLDLLLDGLALLTTDGHGAATPTLQAAAKALDDIPLEDVLRWGWMAMAASNAVWDNDGAHAISARQVQMVRDAGALAELPIYLSALGIASAWNGDFAGAAANIAEADSIAAATGSRFSPWILLRLRALQGREAEASVAIASAIEEAAAGAQGFATYAYWAAAVLYTGLARYEEAASWARKSTSDTSELFVSVWALPELVEAAARAGDAELARDALERLAETTQPCDTDLALGIEARCRALLLSDAAAADAAYREAIDRLSRTRLRPDLARAHLLYGEFLRRVGRRVHAREQLRSAHEMFVAIGMDAFAERTRRELVATGEKVRKHSPETRDELTPQEEQIARLARDGLSNPEIGAQLFLSPRTVEWHLHKVYTKLGISSRRQLRIALSDEPALASA
jgi:DNA-binding CsgD family transcriptional regulator